MTSGTRDRPNMGGAPRYVLDTPRAIAGRLKFPPSLRMPNSRSPIPMIIPHHAPNPHDCMAVQSGTGPAEIGVLG